MSLPLSRRHLLKTFTAGTLTSLVAPQLAGGRRALAAAPVRLVAGRRTLDIDGRAASVFGLTQPNGISGLFTEVGTPFQVELQNDAGEATLVHWHGLIPPYQQDGVPGVSGPTIAPGKSASYDFPLDFPGTYFMHSHQGFQEQLLMSAPLIIREQGGTDDRQEIVLMLHDFAFRSPDEIFAELRKPKPPSASEGTSATPGMAMTAARAGGMPMARDLNDVRFDAFLANDRTLADPQIVQVERSGRVRLRVINAAASSNFMIDLRPVQARLVAVDGHRVQPLTASAFPIAMAQRLDLELELAADQPVLPVFAQLEGERRRTGIVLATAGGPVAKLPALAAEDAPAVTLTMEQALRAAAPLTPRAADRVHQVALTGSMAAYVWSLNGLTYGQDEPLMVAKGERVELVMTNRTMMSHPMHLHGHFFQVVAIDGQRFAGAIRDTVMVPPKQSVTVAFDANSPGRWAFHCHNLYHMDAGMMTTVQYETF